MFRMSPVWLDSSDMVVLRMAGVTVMVCAGTEVYAGMVVFTLAMHVMFGLATIDVAVSSGTEGGDFSSSESGESRSHFMWKCNTRVDHKALTEGKEFLYQSSAIKLDQQCK